jgi:iron complex outermembrane recepter protein
MQMTIKKYISVSLFLGCYTLTTYSQLFVSSEDTSKLQNVELNDFVVNASKDKSVLKELPVSVSILNHKELELNEINSLAGFDGLVPNLFMPDYGSKLTSPIFIRGIGSRINSPAVGLYVDQVPYFEKSTHNIDLFDIESIEVLRGPQGTLYGRNTRGGIINISTLSPLTYKGTKLQLAAGGFGYRQANVSHYDKVGDVFGYSLSVNYNITDGFFTNAFNNSGADNMESYSVRNRLAWKITPATTIENIAFYEKSDEGGYPYAIYNSQTRRANPVNYDHASSYNRQLFSNALVVEHESNGFNITSTTAYQYLDDTQNVDQDFTPDPVFVAGQSQRMNQLSQEVTLRKQLTESVHLLTGISGFYQQIDRSVDVVFGDSGIVRNRLPGPYSYLKTYDNRLAGGALFGQVKYTNFIVSNLTATLGLRVDGEEANLDYVHDKTLLGITSNVDSITFKPISSLQLLPKFALNYNHAWGNFYAQIAKGYKTGGYNSSFEHLDSASFKAEDAVNYEVGIKTSLLDRQLYLDVALFYIDMKNQQIYQTLRSGRGSMLTNAGESVSKGAEIMLKAIPVCGYEVSLNYGYTHATFTDYVKDDNVNYNGKFIPYVPRQTVSANINKTVEVRNSKLIDLFRVNLLFRGAGETYWNEDNKVKEPFYSTIDAKISLIKGAFQLDVFGQNLSDTRYHSFYFESMGNKYVQMGKPRFLGAKLTVKI